MLPFANAPQSPQTNRRAPPAPLTLAYSTHAEPGPSPIDDTFRNAVQAPPSASGSSFAGTPRTPRQRSNFYPPLPPKDGERRPSTPPTGALEGGFPYQQQPAQAGRRTVTKAFSALFGLFVLLKVVGFLSPTHDVLSSLAVPQMEGYALPRLNKAHVSEIAGLRKDTVAAWRAEHLWKAPGERILTKVIKQRKGHYHDTTVIFMHGLGESPYDCVIAAQLRPRLRTIRFVLPESPLRPVDAMGGNETSGWFNMHHLPYNYATDQDEEGIALGVRRLNAVIRAERDELIRNLRLGGGLDSLVDEGFDDMGIHDVYVDGTVEEEDMEVFGTAEERKWAMSRIVIGGFSQGAVVSLTTALTAREPVGGLVALSGFMPLRNKLSLLTADLDRRDLPIFMAHGEIDKVIPWAESKASLRLLQADEPTIHGQGGLGLRKIEYHTYEAVAHTWFPVEFFQVGNWFEKVVRRENRMPKGWKGEGSQQVDMEVTKTVKIIS